MRVKKLASLSVVFLLLGLCVSAQQSLPTTATASAVPNLINYTGRLKDVSGNPLSSVVGVTFLLYAEAQGGAPLWMETQNVSPDSSGRYSVQLGATSAKGLPSDLFRSGSARWLAVQMQGQPEQPRVLLVAVPYALKAADAETIGGLPPSAFVLAAPASASPSTSPAASATGSNTVPPPATSNVTTSGGTVNTIPLFSTATNIQNSILTQTGTTTINVAGKLNHPAAGVATATAGKNSRPDAFVASAFNSGTAAAVAQTFLLQAEPATNNTATPSGTLNLLFGSGTALPTETGLKIGSNGQFTFAPGQTFPGTGTLTGVTTAAGSGLAGGGTTGSLALSLTKSCTNGQVLQWNGTAWACATVGGGGGSITGITAGTDLTGGGTSGNVTLNLNTAALQTANDARYSQLGAINTFSQPQTINSTASTSLTVSSSQPTARVVFGHATNTGSGPAYGMVGGAEGSDGVGVWGWSNGAAGFGVQGKGAMNGVLGWSGFTSSMWNSYAAVGVHGDSGITNSIGVLGTVDTGSAVVGVSTTGVGVTGYGSSAGVYGAATTAGGNSNGVQGASTNATAVRGDDYGTGSGVVGTSAGGVGAYGQSTSGIGLYGTTTSGGIGLYASSPGGTAGLFVGDVQVTGRVTSYNGLATTGNGLTSVVSQYSFYSGGGGNNIYQTFYTPPTDGVYRITAFQECAATSGGSTYFSLGLNWTPPNGGNDGDAVFGPNCSLLNSSHGSVLAHVRGGTAMQYNYAGMDAPFNTLIVVEKIF